MKLNCTLLHDHFQRSDSLVHTSSDYYTANKLDHHVGPSVTIVSQACTLIKHLLFPTFVNTGSCFVLRFEPPKH